jgi:hypothetical protein
MPHLLLFHEFGIGAVVDHILAKHRGSKDSVDILGAHIANLAVEDELIPRGSHAHCCLLAEEDERKDVAMLSTQTIC